MFLLVFKSELSSKETVIRLPKVTAQFTAMIRRAFAPADKKSLRKSGGSSKSSDPKRKSGSSNSGSQISETENSFDMNAWTRLNVGGRILVTTRGTLVKDSQSMLAKMFSAQWNSAVDESGAYLMDRDPVYFEVLLNFLRTNEIVLNGAINPIGVYNEAKYFNLVTMLPTLKKMVDETNRDMTRREFIRLLLACPSGQSLRCQGLNLGNLDLSRLDLSHVNFKLANLKKANLSNCTLDGADLSGAVLAGANLTGATLRGANLSGCDLSGANLSGCDFEDRNGGHKASLEGADLSEANLEDANLSLANCRVANFKYAQVRNSNLRGADLAAANLQGADFTGCNLFAANLKGANVEDTTFDLRSVTSRAGADAGR